MPHPQAWLQEGGPGTLLELLYDVVDSFKRQGKGLVVCDFPRDLRWAEEYETKVGEPSAVILLRCSADTMSRRLQTRRRSTFAVQSDSDGVLQRRAESFCTDSQALISHYENKSILHTIDAERSPDEVLTQICQVMETF
ncbi:hypothetical protein D4764_15G0009550 [Takifugu flavidus]|uniref:Uncharacterized protein n=1 Tax=Takifugu flavidus TaxID=433684 RepID=A0A5C6P460_9TELE|nr:hypothetical protein D4764_15G0009550 [Takifugu flavidus]